MTSILFAILLTTAAPDVELQALSGKIMTGSLAAITNQRVSLESHGQHVELGIEELATLTVKKSTAASSPAPSVWIDLVDGTSLAAQSCVIHGDQAQLHLRSQSLNVSRKDITAIYFQSSPDALAAEWAKILETKTNADLLVIRKNNTLDYHQGVIGDITDNEVQFELDGERLPVKRTKVDGLVFYHPPGPSLPDAICRITDIDGSRWTVHTIALADHNQLEWTTPAGMKIARPLAQVQKINFTSDKVVYLSDLQPELSEWTPFFLSEKELPALNQFFAPRFDRNLRGAPLQIGGRQYNKGLAMHSRTTLAYRLPDRFRRLKAIAGIDDAFRPAGVVRLVIRGDDRVLLDITVTSKENMPVDVDLSGVRRLTILADFAGRLNVGSHLLLCEARVIK